VPLLITAVVIGRHLSPQKHMAVQAASE
jgi:hypothetical protein